MNQYQEFEAAKRAALKPTTKNEITCPTCQNKWFQSIQAITVDRNVQNSLNQKPVDMDSHFILKCLRCGDLHELPISFASSPKKEQDSYMAMQDELGKPWPIPVVPVVEPKPEVTAPAVKPKKE